MMPARATDERPSTRFSDPVANDCLHLRVKINISCGTELIADRIAFPTGVVKNAGVPAEFIESGGIENLRMT